MDYSKLTLLDLTLPQLENYIISIDQKKYRAMQIYEWLHQKFVYQPENMSNLSNELRSKLKEDFKPVSAEIIETSVSSIDQTTKILWLLSNEKKVESVWLPTLKRSTICVSTQAGCSLYCSFCKTAETKFNGNLSPGEILLQVYESQKYLQKKISNVVYMGMGEPFYNYLNTIQSAYELTSDRGMGLGRKKITISTAGVLPKIKRYLDDLIPFNLAISIHSFDHEIRKSLMNAEEQWPVEEIMSYLLTQKRKLEKTPITIEYILIDNLNMNNSDAKLLIKYAKQLKAKVNLIPINNDLEKYKKPSAEKIQQFWQVIKDSGIQVFNRASQGDDIKAACGMLRANNL